MKDKIVVGVTLAAFIVFGILFLYSCGSVPGKIEEEAGAPRYGAVTGKVVDGDTGKAIIGAQIDFSGPGTYRIYSDAYGYFHKDDVLAGTYQVTVSNRPYYGDVVLRGIVIKGDTTNDLGTIKLESKTPPPPPF